MQTQCYSIRLDHQEIKWNKEIRHAWHSTYCVEAKQRSEMKNNQLYLLVSSLCAQMIARPIPACGGRHRRSEAGRSRDARAANKPLAWTAGGNTERKEKNGRGALRRGRISSCFKNLSPWQQIPSPPPLVPTHYPSLHSAPVAEFTRAPLSKTCDAVSWRLRSSINILLHERSGGKSAKGKERATSTSSAV